MIFDHQQSITELEYRQACEASLEPTFELLETVSANCREAATNHD